MRVDKVNIHNDLIKLFTRGSDNDDQNIRLMLINCLFKKSNHKVTDFVTDETICKNVWEQSYLTNGKGLCADQSSRAIQNKITNTRRYINDKLHGKELSTPFCAKVNYYIKRVRVKSLLGLISIFDHLEIQECINTERQINESRKKRRQRKKAQQYFKMGKARIPWVTCEPNIVDGFGRYDLKVKIDEGDQKIPNLNEYREYYKDEWNTYINAQKEDKENTYPGPTFGLHRYKSGENTSTEQPTIKFILKKSNYFQFRAIQRLLKISKFKRKLYKNFDQTKPIKEIAHAISVTIFITIQDGSEEKAIFSERSSRKLVGTGQKLWALPIDETPRREPKNDEYIELEKIDKHELKYDEEEDFVYDVAVRGADEELGITLPKEKIKFLAFGLETNRYLYNIVGLARTGMSRERMELSIETAKHRNREFVGPPEYISFTPEKIYDFWLGIDPSKRCPIAQVASYLALCHVKSVNDMAKFFENYPDPRLK